MAVRKPEYTSQIIKAGALLADARNLLAHWDLGTPVDANLDRFRRENLFCKASRSRAADVLAIFAKRYLGDPAVTRSLVAISQEALPETVLDRLLYFHAARADALLYDVVVEILGPARTAGRGEVSTAFLDERLLCLVEKGRTVRPWSAPTRRRIAQGLLATLRDFGVLHGAVRKRLGSFFLPVEAFTTIAFYLQQRQPSGDRLVADPDWGLFFLDRIQVERLFAEAHQHGLLEYHAAGPVVRIRFPTDSLEEYAHVVARRAA